MGFDLPRRRYAQLYGPTAGDRVRLGDTNLFIEIESDTCMPGDEKLLGAGKTLRDGLMINTSRAPDHALDMAIMGAIVLDPVLGIRKADIGIKEGTIAGIGNAGNPDIMSGLDMLIGGGTALIPAHGRIVTAGGLDVHVHLVSPQQVPEVACSGITTLIGGTPGPIFDVSINPRHLFDAMVHAFENLPVNVGFLGRGSSSHPGPVIEMLRWGCCGLKMHEDLGISPRVIDTCLRVADEFDVPAMIHTDTCNETGDLEDTMASIDGRTIHFYHSEGAGGGHAPDLLRVVSYEHVLPSSTNPTNPFTVNTLEEHLDMIMTVHRLNYEVAEDVAFAESRVRAETVAAEDVLHDMGAISMMSSDSQGMGRIGENIIRTWQVAHSMKEQRGSEGENDNERVLRYLSKYTLCPARACGIADYVGSLEPGKLADIVLWSPAFFGVKPDKVLKCGVPIYEPMGMANATVTFAQPITYKPMFGSFGLAPASLSRLFVSPIAYEEESLKRLAVRRKPLPVRGARRIGKADMIHNSATPNVEVDPETCEVYADGRRITCQPASAVPLAQRYFIG